MAMPASAEMRAVDIPLKAVCWDSLKEALDFHADNLGEYPIIKLFAGETGGGILLVNPNKTDWTFLAFKYDKVNKRTIVCAFFEGTSWGIVNVPQLETEREIEL